MRGGITRVFTGTPTLVSLPTPVYSFGSGPSAYLAKEDVELDIDFFSSEGQIKVVESDGEVQTAGLLQVASSTFLCSILLAGWLSYWISGWLTAIWLAGHLDNKTLTSVSYPPLPTNPDPERSRCASTPRFRKDGVGGSIQFR